jgi:hypothetical protein
MEEHTMKGKWLAIVTLLLSFICALAEAQVNCATDQLNPVCVAYVPEHYGSKQIRMTGAELARPKPPLASLPLAPLARPAVTILTPRVLLEAPMDKSDTPQLSESAQAINPTPSTPTPDCDEDCYSQLVTGSAAATVTTLGASGRRPKNKHFCAEHPDVCTDGHPCIFGIDVEEIRKTSITEDDWKLWSEYVSKGCRIQTITCYFDREGNFRKCP